MPGPLDDIFAQGDGALGSMQAPQAPPVAPDVNAIVGQAQLPPELQQFLNAQLQKTPEDIYKEKLLRMMGVQEGKAPTKKQKFLTQLGSMLEAGVANSRGPNRNYIPMGQRLQDQALQEHQLMTSRLNQVNNEARQQTALAALMGKLQQANAQLQQKGSQFDAKLKQNKEIADEKASQVRFANEIKGMAELRKGNLADAEKQKLELGNKILEYQVAHPKMNLIDIARDAATDANGKIDQEKFLAHYLRFKSAETAAKTMVTTRTSTKRFDEMMNPVTTSTSVRQPMGVQGILQGGAPATGSPQMQPQLPPQNVASGQQPVQGAPQVQNVQNAQGGGVVGQPVPGSPLQNGQQGPSQPQGVIGGGGQLVGGGQALPTRPSASKPTVLPPTPMPSQKQAAKKAGLTDEQMRDIMDPRKPLPPGYSLHQLGAALSTPRIKAQQKQVDKLHTIDAFRESTGQLAQNLTNAYLNGRADQFQGLILGSPHVQALRDAGYFGNITPEEAVNKALNKDVLYAKVKSTIGPNNRMNLVEIHGHEQLLDLAQKTPKAALITIWFQNLQANAQEMFEKGEISPKDSSRVANAISDELTRVSNAVEEAKKKGPGMVPGMMLQPRPLEEILKDVPPAVNTLQTPQTDFTFKRKN
jgi:hypothetical protein